MCALFPPIQIATGAKEGTPGAALPLKRASSKGLHPHVSILLSSNTRLEKSVFVPLSYTFGLLVICTDPPPCDTSGLEGALEDQLAEFDAIYKDTDYDEDTINEDVDSEAKGYLRG
jgi:hypothetical protein